VTPQERVLSDEAYQALEHQVMILIRRSKRAIALRAQMVHPELYPAGYLMLALLAERGPSRPSTIAEVFELDKGATSRQVQQLVDLGLVDREPDPDDRRASLLTPTDLALRGLAEVRDVRRARLSRRLGEWDEEDMADFINRLRRYNEMLEGPELP